MFILSNGVVLLIFNGTKESKMKKFTVYVKEIYDAAYEVEASTEEEARIQVKNGGGIFIDESLEFNRIITNDFQEWDVYEQEETGKE